MYKFQVLGGSNLAAVQNDGIVSTTEYDGRHSSFGSFDQIITLCTVYYVKKHLNFIPKIGKIQLE